MPARRPNKALSKTLLKRIRLVILDVDGVLTDGRMIYGSDGTEYRSFDVYDGFGITRAMKQGIPVALISRGSTQATLARAEKLGITEVYQGERDKMAAYETILASHGLTDEEICYMGDDDYDLPLLRRAGVSVAPPNAMASVRKEVLFVTRAEGGRGAVRELLDLILTAKKLL